MASSGSINTNAYYASDGTRFLTFSWNITSQSVENNTSTISWTLKGGGTSSQYIESGNFNVIVNGSWWFSTGIWDRIRLYNGTTVASGTHTFTHEADGTKSFSVTIQGGLYTYDINCTASKTFDLDIVARASQPSCVTYPEHTQNVGEFGDTISIHMNRKNSGFTHTVRYAFGDLTGTIATGVTTGTTWKIPLSFMDLLPAATTGSGTIYVDTYTGSTKVGTKSCGFTASVPSSVKPTCTLALEDITGIDGIYGSPVKNLSKIKVTVTAKTSYSSPIASYSISANGAKYSGSTATTEALKSSGSVPVTVTVTDKRGRSGTASYTMNVQDYTAPTVTSVTAARCNQDGTANRRGTYIKVTFSAAVSSMSNKNNALYYVLYKKTTATTYSKISFSDLTNNYAPKNYSYIFAAAAGNSYDVVIQAVDRHNSSNPAEKNAKVPTAAAIFSWRGFKSSDGTLDGAGIGKVPEKANTLQVGWDAEFEQNLVKKGNTYAYQPEAFNGEKGYTLLAVITLNTLNVNAPIVFKINRRGATCPMTVYVRFASSSTSTDPDLASITYEGDNYGAFMIKESTSRWKLYVDNTSGWSNPCLQEWYTTDNQMARISVEFRSEQIAGTAPSVLGTYYRATPVVSKSILDAFYPVGYILLLYSHADPNNMYPGTTWVRITNAFLWAVDSSGTIGQTGGEKAHTLTVSEMPKHNHTLHYADNNQTQSESFDTVGATGYGNKWREAIDTNSIGGGAAHNNMPPYIQISAWRRTG